MIEFATMCIGKDWSFEWKDNIRQFHDKHKLHLLTDCSVWFEFKTYDYESKEFSYYDKLIFLLDLMESNKKRITYLDVDKLEQYNNIDYDTTSAYVYNVIDTPMYLSDVFESTRKEIHNHLNIKNESNVYTQEALISLPYTSEFKNIKKDIIELKDIVERNFGNKKWDNPKLNRYSKQGIGYGEGSALTAVLLKYNIPIVNVYSKFRKESII
tara:strand:+ start:7941 stop:8576 length:636 start_codon:yes stop_codon:yes gene_type:complete